MGNPKFYTKECANCFAKQTKNRTTCNRCGCGVFNDLLHPIEYKSYTKRLGSKQAAIFKEEIEKAKKERMENMAKGKECYKCGHINPNAIKCCEMCGSKKFIEGEMTKKVRAKYVSKSLESRIRKDIDKIKDLLSRGIDPK